MYRVPIDLTKTLLESKILTKPCKEYNASNVEVVVGNDLTICSKHYIVNCEKERFLDEDYANNIFKRVEEEIRGKNILIISMLQVPNLKKFCQSAKIVHYIFKFPTTSDPKEIFPNNLEYHPSHYSIPQVDVVLCINCLERFNSFCSIQTEKLIVVEHNIHDRRIYEQLLYLEFLITYFSMQTIYSENVIIRFLSNRGLKLTNKLSMERFLSDHEESELLKLRKIYANFPEQMIKLTSVPMFSYYNTFIFTFINKQV